MVVSRYLWDYIWDRNEVETGRISDSGRSTQGYVLTYFGLKRETH